MASVQEELKAKEENRRTCSEAEQQTGDLQDVLSGLKTELDDILYILQETLSLFADPENDT